MFLAVASSRRRLSGQIIWTVFGQTGEQHSFTATASQPKKDVECVIFYDPVTKASPSSSFRPPHCICIWRRRSSVKRHTPHIEYRISNTGYRILILILVQLLAIERLDYLLTVNHQPGSSAATPLSTFTAANTQSSSASEKQQPAPTSISQQQQQQQHKFRQQQQQQQQLQQPQQRPLATRTAPPIPSSRSLPTPPSTSPPDFVSLPAVRNAALPRKKPARATQPSEDLPATAPVTKPPPGRSSTSASSLAHIALPPLPASNSTHGNTSTPHSQPASLSAFAIQQRALEAQATDATDERPNVSNSAFASDPDDLFDLSQPTSANALQLSTSSTSSRKRQREDDDDEESDPDEEELQFGQQTRQIKRAKTSQSPASGSDATPHPVPNTGYRSTPGVTNSSYTPPFGVRPDAPSLIHGHSPLAQSFSPNEESQEQAPPPTQVQYEHDEDEDEDDEEENSDSDSDSTDSDDEVLHPSIQQDTYVYTVPDPNPIVYHHEEEDDSDEDEEDFLMQALGESDQGAGRGSGTVAASEYCSGDDGETDFQRRTLG